MATPLITSNANKLLKNTLQDVFIDEFKGDLIWPKYGFEQKTTDEQWVEDQEFAGLGLMPRKVETQPMYMDSIQQGYTTRYTQVTYALRMAVSEELLDFNRYDEILNGAARLGESAKRTQEYEMASVFIRAADTSYAMADGLPLASASHKLPKGGTYSNILATPMSLSEVGIETLIIAARKQVGSNGLRRGYKLKKLVVPSELMFRAARILKSDQQNDTANNAINVLKGMGIEVVDSPYLTSATNWFGITDAKPGLKVLFSKKPTFTQTNHESSLVKEFQGSQRFAYGVTDPRSVVASLI